MRHRATCAGYARCATPDCPCWCDHTQDRRLKPSRARAAIGPIPKRTTAPIFRGYSLLKAPERFVGGQPPDDDERGLTL